MSDRKVSDSPIKDLEYRRKKVEDYGSTLAQIRARVKANRAACPKKDFEDGEDHKEGIIEEISERCQTFKKLVEEDRLKMAEIEKDRPKIQATVEALKKDKEVWKQREQRIQESLAKQNAAAPLEVPGEVKKKLLDMEDLISDLKEKLAAKEKVISSQVQAVKALNEQLSERTKEFYEKVEQMSTSVSKIEAEHASHEDMLKKQIEMYKDELQESVLQTNAKEKECKRLLGVEKELTLLKEEHSQCTSKMDLLNTQIESMNNLVVKLKVQLKNIKSERDNLLEKQDEESLKELKNRVTLLEEEKGNWQLQLIDYDEMKGKYEETVKQIKYLEEKIYDLEKVNSELTSQKDILFENILKEKDTEISSLQNSLQLSKEASDNLKEQWKSEFEEATEKFQHTLESAEKNRLDLETTIKSLENEKNALLSDLEAVRSQLGERESTVLQLETKVTMLEERVASLSSSVDSQAEKELLDQLNSSQVYNSTLLSELEVLKKLNKKLKEEVSEHTAKSWNTEMVVEELREAQIASLQEKDKRIAALEKEMSEMKVAHQTPTPADTDQTIKLKKLAAKCKMQAKQCKEMEGEIERLTQGLERGKGLIEKGLIDKRLLEDQLGNALKELAALKEGANGEGEVAPSQEGEGAFQQVISSKDDQIRELVEKLNFYEETVNIEELEKMKHMYEVEFVKNDSVLSNLKVFEKELTQSKESVETISEQLTKVKCDYEKALLNSQERECYVETLEQDLVNMKTKMYSIESNIEDRHKEIEEKAKNLEVKLEETLAKNALFLKYHGEMGQKMALFQDNENSMKETIASLTSLMNQSESRLFQVESEKSELEEKNNQLNLQLNSQLERLSDLEREIEELTATLTTKDQMIGTLREKEHQSVTKIEEVSHLNRSYGEELNILRQEVQLKSEKLTQAGKEMSDLIEQAEHLYREKELLQSHISSMSKKLLSLNEGPFHKGHVVEEPSSSAVPAASILFTSEKEQSRAADTENSASNFFTWTEDDDGWGWGSQENTLLKKVEELEREKGETLANLEESQHKIAKLMKVIKKLKEEKESGNSIPQAPATMSQGTWTNNNDNDDNTKKLVEEKNALEKQMILLRAENYQLKVRAEDLEKNLAEIKPHYDLINNSLMVAQNESYSLSILLQEKETTLANLQKANEELKENIASLELELSEIGPKAQEEELPAQEVAEDPTPIAQKENEAVIKQRETDERISNLFQSFFSQDPNATQSLFEVAQLEQVAAPHEPPAKKQPPQDHHTQLKILGKEVESLGEAKEQLELALKQAQKAVDETEARLTRAFTLELKSAQECVATLERELNSLREEKAQVERDCDVLRRQLEENQERVKQLNDHANDSQEINNSLQSELELMKAENGRLKHKEAERHAELEIHQSKAEALDAQVSSLTAKMRKSEEMCASLKSQLETLRGEHLQLEEMSASGHNHLLLENQHLKTLINERDSADQLLNQQIARESEAREALNERYLAIQSYCQELSASVAQQSDSVETLKAKLDEAQDANHLLQTLLNDKQKQIDTLQRELHVKGDEANQIQLLLEQKMSEIDSSMMALAKKDLELEQLSTILTETQNKLVQMKELNTSENEMRLQRKLDDALRVAHEQDVKFEEYSLELMRLLEERDTLQLRLSNVLRKNEELERKCEEVRSHASPSLPLNPCRDKIGELQGTYSKDITLKAERESRHNDQMNLLFSWPDRPNERGVSSEPPKSLSDASFSSSFHKTEGEPSDSDYGFMSWFFKSPSGKDSLGRSGT